MNCEICKSEFRNKMRLKDHEGGKRHRQNIWHKLMADFINAAELSLATDRINNFSCTPCFTTFHTISSFRRHLKEEEHAKKNKTNSVSFYTKNSNILSNLPFYYCKICHIRCSDLESCRQHLRGYTHKRIQHHFNLMFDRKDESVCRQSQSEVSKPYFCDLCIIQCTDPKSYDFHLAGKKHKGFEHFVNNLLNENKKDAYLDEKDCDHFNDLLTRQRFCKICNVRCSNSKEYDIHLNSKNHRSNEQFISNLYNGNDGNANACYFDERVFCILQSGPPPYYCKRCNIWCQNYDFYEQHNSAHHKEPILSRDVLDSQERKRCCRCVVLQATTCVVEF